MPARRVARSALFALAGFVCARTAIDAGLPAEYADELVKEKLGYFSAHRDDFTTVAIGASRVYRELIPGELDAALARRGVSTRTFNLALPGMKAAEARFLIERVAELRPRNLRYLIVDEDFEGDEFGPPHIAPANTRNVYWLTAGELARDVGYHARSAEGWRGGFSALYHLLPLAAIRASGRGRLTLWDDWISPEESIHSRDLPVRLGYFALEWDTGPTFLEMRRYFLSHPDEFARILAQLPESFRPGPPPYSPRHLALQDILAMARRNGWKVLFLRPVLAQIDFPTGCEKPRPDCAAIGFEDRKTYAQFYRRESFYDYFHLTREQAPPYTRLIARRMTELPGFLERP